MSRLACGNILPALLPLLTLIAPSCASGPKTLKIPSGVSSEVTPLIGEFKVHRFRLANGLRLLVVPDKTSPTFAYQTWFDVGSRDEEPGYTGLAHLFEHMMFKGTKNLKDGEFDRTLETAGAQGMNAFTSRDYTAYIQELPKDKLELIAGLESDRMVNLIVNDESFKTEREVVQNERRYRNENSPDGLMYQEIFGLAFKSHPYRWPVIGFQEDLDRMSGEHAREFYKTFYRPNHAVIIVSGDVEPLQVLDSVHRYYGGISAQTPPERTIPKEPEQKGIRRKTLKLNIQVQKMMMAFHTPDVNHPDSAALEVLRTILSSGRASRLHRALVETGISTSVGSYNLDDKDPSLLLVATNLQKGRQAAQAEAAILREIKRVSETPVTGAELDRARNAMSYEFYQNLSNNFEKAEFIGRYEILMGSYEAAIAAFNRSLQVTPEQIRQVARKYLRPDARNIIVGVPK